MKSKPGYRIFAIALSVMLAFLCISCVGNDSLNKGEYYSFKDSLGNEVSFDRKPERVVCLLGSYAETALLAGLNVVGATADAITERGLDFDEKTQIVGTVKEPNIEKVLSANPDLVVLSTDIPSHSVVKLTLEKAKINFCFFKEESFSEYLTVLKHFTALSGKSEWFELYGLNVQKEIEEAVKVLPDKKRIVLYRAYSGGLKAKGKDTVAGKILIDLNCENIADIYPSVLDNLSDEAVVSFNPEFIFVVPMGEKGEESANTAVNNILQKAAFSEITAVVNKKVIALPKNLFHYKPNSRWGESYSYAKQILMA